MRNCPTQSGAVRHIYIKNRYTCRDVECKYNVLKTMILKSYINLSTNTHILF